MERANIEAKETLELTNELAKLHGPPGQEDEIAAYVTEYWHSVGLPVFRDPKGNIVVDLSQGTNSSDRPSVLVLAHMDEVAMIVTHIESDGLLGVDSLGDTLPIKLGEGPVDLLTPKGTIPGVLSMGSIHTFNSTNAHFANQSNSWGSIRVFTGRLPADLEQMGIRPGTCVCVSRARKGLAEFGSFVGGYALDNRALLAILLRLSLLIRDNLLGCCIYLAATVSEEVGGHGASYLGQSIKPTITVALDVLPWTSEDTSRLDSSPGAWVRDGRGVYDRRELERINRCMDHLEFKPHWVLNPKSATDASFLVSNGNTARAVAVGIPVANTHGFEIIHKDAPDNLLRLLVAYLSDLRAEMINS